MRDSCATYTQFISDSAQVICGNTWFIRGSYVVHTWFISDIAQVMRGAFVVHKHLLAMFGAYALICAEVRALLVICT